MALCGEDLIRHELVIDTKRLDFTERTFSTAEGVLAGLLIRTRTEAERRQST